MLRWPAQMAEMDDACDTCGNHLFYLSTPPQLYPIIVAHLARPSQSPG